MKLTVGAGIITCLISHAQTPIPVVSWAAGQVESVMPPSSISIVGNPAFVYPFSLQIHYHPTVPGFQSMSAMATGGTNAVGWMAELGSRGNELLAHQRLRLGVSAKKEQFQIGIRAGLHVWQHQQVDRPSYWLPAIEMGALYRISSQWQTGFFAGGDAWNRFWCSGISYKPSDVWQCQLEWNAGIRGGFHYLWRPDWSFHAGFAQRSLRTGLMWQSRHWILGAGIARWAEGWITSTYSLHYQP